MPTGFLLLAAIGVVTAVAAALAMRVAGAQAGVARRLAGPVQMRVGELLDGDLPERAVRVAGRIRCSEPLRTPDGDRLVAFHRDVEVRVAGRWRPIERLRETRSFELWDDDGSLTLDPADAAEPLIVIPGVWRGSPDALEEPHAGAVARVAEQEGPITEARAVNRTIAVSDRLLVLARVERDGAGVVRLVPPPGGYLITNLALADAMRLLGGPHRRVLAAAIVGLVVGAAATVIGLIGAAATWLIA